MARKERAVIMKTKTVLTDDKGNVLTKSEARNIVIDHILTDLRFARESKEDAFTINFSALIQDSDEITLGEVIDFAGM